MTPDSLGMLKIYPDYLMCLARATQSANIDAGSPTRLSMGDIQTFFYELRILSAISLTMQAHP